MRSEQLVSVLLLVSVTATVQQIEGPTQTDTGSIETKMALKPCFEVIRGKISAHTTTSPAPRYGSAGQPSRLAQLRIPRRTATQPEPPIAIDNASPALSGTGGRMSWDRCSTAGRSRIGGILPTDDAATKKIVLESANQTDIGDWRDQQTKQQAHGAKLQGQLTEFQKRLDAGSHQHERLVLLAFLTALPLRPLDRPRSR